MTETDTDHGLTDDDIEQLQQIKENNGRHMHPSEYHPPYENQDELQDAVLAAAPDEREWFRARDLSGEIDHPDGDLSNQNIGSVLKRLAERGNVERVEVDNYGKQGAKWTVVDDA